MGPTDAAIKKISDIYRKAIYIKAREYEKLTDLMRRLEDHFPRRWRAVRPMCGSTLIP